MTVSLHNLKRKKTAVKRRIRVGRGNSSGHGSYSGRGMKGQRARSGGKAGLKLKGLRTFLSNVPKLNGFRSLRQPILTVNLQDLEKHFKDGDKITSRQLLQKGLINTHRFGVKVLGSGKLTKKLDIMANSFSQSAKDAIIKAGGKAEVAIRSKRPAGVKGNKKSIAKKR